MTSDVTKVSPQAANPANPPEAVTSTGVTARTRIPMSVPQRKLEVPNLPGYVLYWFRDSNVPRALQAGYEFVQRNELPVNQMNVATDKGISGNQDLGNHIRVYGGLDAQNQPEFGTLMKIREEWWREDQAKVANKNAGVLKSIFKKEAIAGDAELTPEDREHRYIKTALFQRPARKAQIEQ